MLPSMKNSRKYIAAAAAVVALGAFATVALALGGETDRSNSTAAPIATRSAPVARTDRVRETHHRHAHHARKRSRGGATPAATPAATTAASVATPDDRRGRGADDQGVDDRGGLRGGHGADDNPAVEDRGDDHGGNSGRGGGGHDD
jgi:hypothetical protein